ncbi:MAG: lipopolysaccharide biosynthesis protein [Gaiellales bacterium]
MSSHGRHRALVGQAFTYGSGAILARIVGFFLVPVYLAAAGTAAFGAAELVISAVAVGAIVLRLGIVASMSRYTLAESADGDWAPVIHTVFGFVLAVSTAGVVVGALLLDELAAFLDIGRDLAVAGLFALWVTMNYDVIARLYRIERRAGQWVRVMVLNVALSAVLTVTLVVVFDEGALGLLVGNFAATAVLYACLVVARRHTIGFRRFDRSVLRELLRFSLPLMPANLAIWAINFADRIQLQKLAGPLELGQYAAAARVALALTVVTGAFQTAWAPFAHAVRGEEGDEVAKQTYSEVFTYWAIVAGWGLVAVTMLSAPYIVITFPRQAEAAVDVVPLLALGIVLYGAYLIVNVAVTISKRTRATPLVAGVAAAATIGLNFWLIPEYGLIGAGITTVVGSGLLVGLQWLNAQRSYPIAYEWSRVGRVAAVALGLAALSVWAIPERGVLGISVRVALVLVFPAALVAVRAVSPADARRLRGLWRARRRSRAVSPTDDLETPEP